MDSLFVYQVGEVVLDTYRDVMPEYYGTEMDYEIKDNLVSASLNSVQARFSGGISFKTPYKSNIGQKLRSYQEQGIPVFVFSCLVNDVMSDDDGNQIWLYTTCLIKNVTESRSSNYNNPTLEVQVELLDHWKCIDLTSFCYSSDFYSDIDYVEEVQISDLPTFNEAIKNKNSWVAFNYRSYNHIYDQENWLNVFCECDEKECGNVLYKEKVNKWYEVETDPYIFGGNPKSMYALNALDKNRIIKIKTISKQEFNNVTREVTIDLSLTNKQVINEGYFALTNDDILVIGDISRYYNGRMYKSFVLRNGQILENVFPIIKYDGKFPGQLNSGKNRIIVFTDDDVTVSWIHYFRRI